MEIIVGIAIVISTLIGLTIGISKFFSWVSKRKRGKQLWEKYSGVLKAFKEADGNVWRVKTETEEHRLAEEMVKQGMLERVPIPGGLGYGLPGNYNPKAWGSYPF